MKIGLDLNQIGHIDHGELVLKLPGTDFKMIFENGEIYLSDTGIGYASLPVKRIDCQENGEPEGMLGQMGRLTAQQLMDPDVKPLLDKILASRDMSLFYSRTGKGLEIITLPGISDEEAISEGRVIAETIAASYPIKFNIPSVERVYALHINAIEDRKIIRNRKVLEKEVLQIVSKANGVYEKSLQMMKE